MDSQRPMGRRTTKAAGRHERQKKPPNAPNKPIDKLRLLHSDATKFEFILSDEALQRYTEPPKAADDAHSTSFASAIKQEISTSFALIPTPPRIVSPARAIAPSFAALQSITPIHGGRGSASTWDAHYALTILWPTLFCEPSFATSWFRGFCTDPLLYHAFSVGVAVHLDVLRNEVVRTSSRRILCHKAKVIKLLSQYMAEWREESIDQILVAILILAKHELDECNMQKPVTEMEFEPHMPHLSWVSVYGRLQYIPAHAQAMMKVVQRIGGLKAIKMPGLGMTVALADLINASVTASKPVFPCMWEPDLAILRLHPTLRTVTGSTPGRGFFVAAASGFLPSDTASVLIRLATIDRYMALRRPTPLPQEEERELAHTRNAIQHAFLSLHSTHDVDDEDQQATPNPVSTTVLLTTNLYTAAVVMGIPPHLGWQLPQASNIRSHLQTSIHNWPTEASNILLWSLCVGSLATSSGGDDCQWFTSWAREVLRRHRFTNWAAAERVLEDLLWSPRACSGAEERIWFPFGEEVLCAASITRQG